MIDLLYDYPDYLAQEIAKTMPKLNFGYSNMDPVKADLMEGIYSKYKNTGNPEIDRVVSLLEKYDTAPDPNLTYDDMYKYGYTWKGMMPVSFDVAVNIPFRVYKLFPNGQEKEAYNPLSAKRNRDEDIKNMKEWTDKGGMLGIAHDERIRWVFKNVSDEMELTNMIKHKDIEKDR